MLMVTTTSATANWAMVTTRRFRLAVSAQLASVSTAIVAVTVAGQLSRTRPASRPPRPRVDTSPAQNGPYRPAAVPEATSHSGPNSKITCSISAVSTVSATAGATPGAG